MRNDLVSTAGGASADAESIHRALGQLDFTHVVDARNPGFDAARWEEFLRVYTEPVAAPYADVRRIKWKSAGAFAPARETLIQAGRLRSRAP